MTAGYTQISVRNVRTCRDGALVFTTGRFRRFLTGSELIDREHTLELVGEPFDFLPPHDTALEVWGQLWLGSRPRLLVHDARHLGDTRPGPQVSRRPEPGESAQLLARVASIGGGAIATTPQHHTYLLTGEVGPPGLYHLAGHVLSLTPPVFKVATCTPVPEAPSLLAGGS